jgi:hypothetical protein
MGFTFDFNVGFIFDPFLHGGILGSFENPGAPKIQVSEVVPQSLGVFVKLEHQQANARLLGMIWINNDY